MSGGGGREANLASRKLTHRVRLERRATARDVHGHPADEWEAIADCWAWIMFGTGQERRVAAQESASAPATVRVRRSAATASLTPADRVRFDAAVPGAALAAAPIWNIVGVAPIGRDAIELAVVRSQR